MCRLNSAEESATPQGDGWGAPQGRTIMRLREGRWLVGLAVATGLMVSVSGHAVMAAQSQAPVEINSFSGAYLAARIAEVDNDLDGAIAYYKKALAFDPENQPLQQSLMLALVSQGRFDEALPYANKL